MGNMEKNDSRSKFLSSLPACSLLHTRHTHTTHTKKTHKSMILLGKTVTHPVSTLMPRCESHDGKEAVKNWWCLHLCLSVDSLSKRQNARQKTV